MSAILKEDPRNGTCRKQVEVAEMAFVLGGSATAQNPSMSVIAIYQRL
jgi:hypothetical protein